MPWLARRLRVALRREYFFAKKKMELADTVGCAVS
jgi:glucose-6-phosphate dehydrogenase assembly protein OpcA